MVGVVKIFGWFSVLVAAALFFLSFRSFYLATILVPVAASALLGGALLIVFARIVQLLESLDSKLSPVFEIASVLESKYRPQSEQTTFDPLNDPDAVLRSPPRGAQLRQYKGRRMVVLQDGSVVAETMSGRGRWFPSFEDFRDFVGE